MDHPTFLGARAVAPDTTTFTAFYPIGDLGVLPVNAHLVHSREPVLVDTSGVAVREQYLKAVCEAIDPHDLRWIFLSHMDMDHIGNLEAMMALAPNATVVTAGLGIAKLSLREGFDMSRVRPLEAGQRLDVGDRELVSIKPVSYDAPETNGFFDTKTRVLFSADAFGALLDQPYEEIAEIPATSLRDGMTMWAGIDAPWLGMVDRTAFGHLLSDIVRLDPSAIISAHLPVATGVTERLLGNLMGSLSEDRFGHPDRDTIEALLAREAA
jgi:glyoxylase-like metal-dependent hydrolase (beta-lactamase superfamily II)